MHRNTAASWPAPLLFEIGLLPGIFCFQESFSEIFVNPSGPGSDFPLVEMHEPEGTSYFPWTCRFEILEDNRTKCSRLPGKAHPQTSDGQDPSAAPRSVPPSENIVRTDQGRILQQ